MYPRHSQIMKMDVTVVLFIEILDLRLHYDPMFDSLYIASTSHFCLYFFTCRDFVVPFFHPLFDPVAPYIAISLHMAHPAPPVAPPALASPPTSPPQVVPSLSLDDEDPSEAVESSSSSSSGPSCYYTLAEPGMANGFLSSASD